MRPDAAHRVRPRKPAEAIKQRGSQFPPFAQGQRILTEHLNANIVGPGGVMVADTIPDSAQIAPGNDGVDQAVTAPILEVVFVESQP
jgi:hypothetical protein